MGQVVGLFEPYSQKQAQRSATARERGVQMVDLVLAGSSENLLVIGITPDGAVDWIADAALPLDSVIVALDVIHASLLDARRAGGFDDDDGEEIDNAD